ncbi:MAG: HEPN domain-containing protein [Ignavibacteriaceae bacterium]
MDENKITLANYRILQSKEKIESAELLLEKGLLGTSLSNSYYSIFHSTRVLFALEGIDSKSHKGVIHLFNIHFIKTGLLPKNLNSILSSALEMRFDSDYEDFYVVSKEETEEQLNNAKLFLDSIINFVKLHYDVELKLLH